MAGLYFHIPFCSQKCHYCNFFSQPAKELLPRYIESVCKEIALQKEYLQSPVRTIYFGGGTPSLLEENHFKKIFHAIHRHLNTDPDETTIEVNPNDITASYIRMLRHTGFNRLSMGIQSFSDTDLQWLNRSHTGAQARQAYTTAREGGFRNISIDLIYGMPIQNINTWKKQIETAMQLRPEHLSAYALTVEKGTALAHFIHKGIYPPVSDETLAEDFALLCKILKREGYTHYEVSNFALPGYEAKHNASYWDQTHYLGIGASAHSYNGTSRQWNVAAINKYMEHINRGEIPSEKEELTLSDQLNEYVLTSLRTAAGCNLSHISTVYGETEKERIKKNATRYIQTGLLSCNKNILKTTQKGWFYIDGIAAELFTG
ncbi:MAG: radical SAM family heme chaperone HemW [Bacteroidales bacterium]|nr:radical SAM family heme chaperone HemW [Bacteroidales bacterium]